MALSFEQFMEATGAELVGGNIVAGMMADRKKVGDLNDGVFNLNDDGHEMAAEIEAAAAGAKSPKAAKAAKAAGEDGKAAE